ncbi:hypothetical protein B7463_g642, partial [Scytalidium lignicola]
MRQKHTSLHTFLYKEVLKSRLKVPSTERCRSDTTISPTKPNENPLTEVSNIAKDPRNENRDDGEDSSIFGSPSPPASRDHQAIPLEVSLRYHDVVVPPPFPPPIILGSTVNSIESLKEELKAVIFSEIDATRAEKHQLGLRRVDLIKKITGLEKEEQNRKNNALKEIYHDKAKALPEPVGQLERRLVREAERVVHAKAGTERPPKRTRESRNAIYSGNGENEIDEDDDYDGEERLYLNLPLKKKKQKVKEIKDNENTKKRKVKTSKRNERSLISRLFPDGLPRRYGLNDIIKAPPLAD